MSITKCLGMIHRVFGRTPPSLVRPLTVPKIMDGYAPLSGQGGLYLFRRFETAAYHCAIPRTGTSGYGPATSSLPNRVVLLAYSGRRRQAVDKVVGQVSTVGSSSAVRPCSTWLITTIVTISLVTLTAKKRLVVQRLPAAETQLYPAEPCRPANTAPSTWRERQMRRVVDSTITVVNSVIPEPRHSGPYVGTGNSDWQSASLRGARSFSFCPWSKCKPVNSRAAISGLQSADSPIIERLSVLGKQHAPY